MHRMPLAFYLISIIALGYSRPTEEDDFVSCIDESSSSSDVSEADALKKFLYCFYKKTDVITGDGHIKIDNFLEKLPENMHSEKVREVLNKCNSLKTASTPEQTVLNIFTCIHAV
ncbi:hypothetical protein JYU34_003728 [Plutella xylostella]|uniref:Uncharacterized protein n=2 Tax=Plutella xylostella TaxID=51655 RepID=A0ABQ7R0R7_PLUXY|nr:uncharacterized protein LOC105387541 [Plutella xylostella]KAG7310896.1 hypothetical protein JYU34_003728 [Plutella xylostella]CAG9118161.1 unnamed protein product [Plutella xylostella]